MPNPSLQRSGNPLARVPAAELDAAPATPNHGWSSPQGASSVGPRVGSLNRAPLGAKPVEEKRRGHAVIDERQRTLHAPLVPHPTEDSGPNFAKIFWLIVIFGEMERSRKYRGIMTDYVP